MYGVITSQLHRFNMVCMRPEDFMQPAVKLRADYVDKGYSWNKIKRYFYHFARHHMHHMKATAVADNYCRQYGEPAPRVVQ